jgi:hypothetical protein
MSILTDNNYDSIERLIYEGGLRIEAIDFHTELDVMLVILNTKAVLHQKISSYPRLKGASKEDLMNHNFISKGTGVHWESLDEDLSLKGFLRDELKNVIQLKTEVAA